MDYNRFNICQCGSNYRLVATVISMIFFSPYIMAVDIINVGEFSKGELNGWETKSFTGETIYKLVDLGGEMVLKAESNGTASGLVRTMKIDLSKTPFLNWSWRVENTFGNVDEKKKNGDDYPARIYVLIGGGLLFWRTRALNYVWASSSPVDNVWPNAFAGTNVMMIAIQSGKDQVGEWQRQKRNVKDDLQKIFLKEFTQIDAIALMTDADNTRGRAIAYFGDIYFSSD